MTSPLAQILLLLAAFLAAADVNPFVAGLVFAIGVIIEVARNAGIGTPEPEIRQ